VRLFRDSFRLPRLLGAAADFPTLDSPSELGRPVSFFAAPMLPAPGSSSAFSCHWKEQETASKKVN